MSSESATNGVTETGEEPGAPVKRPHSRRTLVTGAAMGLVGAAVASLATATPAAADGPDVELGNGGTGAGNDAGSAQTSITSDYADGATLNIFNTSSGGSGIFGTTGGSGLGFGPAGVIGETNVADGFGVHGGSVNGTGVLGTSESASSLYSSFTAGVVGDTNASGVYGVVGTSGQGPGGVLGQAPSGIGVSGTGGDGGVFGQVTTASGLSILNSPGVLGDSGSGDGVLGLGSFTNGVHGVYGGYVSASLSQAGVYGESNAGPGVCGTTSLGTSAGVLGTTTDGFGVQGIGFAGVYGQTATPSGIRTASAGVVGDSDSVPGVLGTSTGSQANGIHGVYGGYGSASLFQAGVYGESNAGPGVCGTSSSAGAAGVLGTSSVGIGVSGLSSSDDAGVYGSNSGSGPCVQAATSGSGPGVLATADNGGAAVVAQSTGAAAALEVEGIATFTRSGLKTLSAAAASVDVTVPGGLSATSHVLATLQTDTGTLAVRAAVPDTSTGKVTIHFTGSAPTGTTVAWFVFG